MCLQTWQIWHLTRDVESSFFVGLQLQSFKKLGLRLQPLKIPRLWLRVKVGHRLLNLCDCDSVLSEWCRQTNSQDLKKNNSSILLWSYLNLISVISCSKTVHNITQTKFKLLVNVQSDCTKIIWHCNKYIKIQKQSSFWQDSDFRI